MNITLEQAIEALESNESDAMNGRIDFVTFKERNYRLEMQFRSLLTQKAIQRAQKNAAELVATYPKGIRPQQATGATHHD